MWMQYREIFSAYCVYVHFLGNLTYGHLYFVTRLSVEVYFCIDVFFVVVRTGMGVETPDSLGLVWITQVSHWAVRIQFFRHRMRNTLVSLFQIQASNFPYIMSQIKTKEISINSFRNLSAVSHGRIITTNILIEKACNNFINVYRRLLECCLTSVNSYKKF